MPHLISFDIDGTLVTGDGPGPITLEMVRRAIEQGHIVGSASDRPVANQKAMWEAIGLTPEFTVNKHLLDQVRSKYEAEAYYHIGDTDMDRYYAELHGFEFLQVQTMEPHPWMAEDTGEVLWGPFGRTTASMELTPTSQLIADALPDIGDAGGAEGYDYSNG